MRLGITMIILISIVVNVLLGGICTQYVVEYWATYFKEVSVTVPFLPCAIVGLFLGEITIPAAVVTWILSFVL
ncbi:MAG: hypothetical protein ACE5F2_01530 [Candidatus Paceibacteria bacterium]